MKKTICFVTLGCAKNTVYSEYMMGLCADSDYILVEEPAEATVIVVNTCGFITAAKEETINTILALNDYKEAGSCEFLVAIGCMVQKYAKEMEEALPELDLLLGSTAYDEILAHIDRLYAAQEAKTAVDTDWHLPNAMERDSRVLSTPGYYAYLTIAEGCDNHCTFCAIPEMQGPYRSRAREDILAEAEMLARRGVKELIVIAQDITTYGLDNYGRLALPELLHDLCKIDGIRWIRLLYAYPNNLSDDLIATIASEEKICKYIDIPLQHADDEILARMNRKIDQAQIRALIAKLRERVPGIMIRSTFIVGFPGETEADFQDTLDLVETCQFDNAFSFIYSPRPGTAAAKFDDQIPLEVSKERLQRLNAALSKWSLYHNKKYEGKTVQVLVEGLSENNDNMLSGKTDSAKTVIFEGDSSLIGTFVNVTITTAQTWVLKGNLEEQK